MAFALCALVIGFVISKTMTAPLMRLVDAAMPGMLPVINRRAVEATVLSGLAIGAAIFFVFSTWMAGRALLAPDTVLIPQPAMRRWLQKTLAEDARPGRPYLELHVMAHRLVAVAHQLAVAGKPSAESVAAVEALM